MRLRRQNTGWLGGSERRRHKSRVMVLWEGTGEAGGGGGVCDDTFRNIGGCAGSSSRLRSCRQQRHECPKSEGRLRRRCGAWGW